MKKGFELNLGKLFFKFSFWLFSLIYYFCKWRVGLFGRELLKDQNSDFPQILVVVNWDFTILTYPKHQAKCFIRSVLMSTVSLARKCIKFIMLAKGWWFADLQFSDETVPDSIYLLKLEFIEHWMCECDNDWLRLSVVLTCKNKFHNYYYYCWIHWCFMLNFPYGTANKTVYIGCYEVFH